MYQPRFGGVATLPLSRPSGEGKYEKSKMGSRDPPHHHSIPQNGEAAQVETNQEGVWPATEDPKVKKVMEVLWNLNILVDVEQHHLKHDRQKEGGEVYCKNLLLKDKKGQIFLVLFDEHDTPDLQVLKYHLKAASNLHFASSASVVKLLGVQPGAVTPLAFIHSSARGVRLFMDAALIGRIDRDVTKLFFHPLRAELQVGLTLSQLENFLNHCGVTLEMLPSLRTYGARRWYNTRSAGRFKYVDHEENGNPTKVKFKADITEAPQHAAKPVKQKQQAVKPTKEEIQLTEQLGKPAEQAVDFLVQHKMLFEELKINVEVTQSSNLNDQFLACKCVYLKDKKDNYFLFICHVKQKVDFSNLKMQLKPSKKITPLDSGELSSLLKMREDRANPFLLAGLKQPRFLVAIAENLYQRHGSVLIFPHPSCSDLHIQVTLKDVEVFVKGAGHDLVTIPVKGTLESVLVSTPPCGNPKPSSLAATAIDIEHSSDSNSSNIPPITSDTETASSTDLIQVCSTIPAHRKENLFYRLMAPFRDWMTRCIRRLILLFSNSLPRQIKAPLLQRSIQEQEVTSASIKSTEELTEAMSFQEQRGQKAKLSKLKQLISNAGITVEMTQMPTKSKFHISETEPCKTYLLRNENGHPYIVLCAEKDVLSEEDYHNLRREFRSRSALSQVTSEDIMQRLSWQEGETPLLWTVEDLNPLLLTELDQQRYGQVQIGVRLALYCFPDTSITFDLVSLGVTLRLSFDDLESMLRRMGFCIVYLP